MTVRQLLNSIDSHELAEWMAFFRLNPFGERRADIRAALISSVIANVNRGKDQPPFKVEDFIIKYDQPELDEPERVQDWQQQLALVEMLNSAFGGKDQREKRNDNDRNGQRETNS